MKKEKFDEIADTSFKTTFRTVSGQSRGRDPIMQNKSIIFKIATTIGKAGVIFRVNIGWVKTFLSNDPILFPLNTTKNQSFSG